MATILVIDDEPRMLRVIGEILRGAGHEVVEAISGDIGIAIIAKQDAHWMPTGSLPTSTWFIPRLHERATAVLLDGVEGPVQLGGR